MFPLYASPQHDAPERVQSVWDAIPRVKAVIVGYRIFIRYPIE